MKKWILVGLIFTLAFFPMFSAPSAWGRTKHSHTNSEKGKKGKKKGLRKGKGSKGTKSPSGKESVGTIGKKDVEFDTKSPN
jgi:hypothetical protein